MNIVSRIFHFYADGFRSMTWGRKLWVIIGVKLFIMFAILKWLFFPDFLKGLGGEDAKSEYISLELINRAINP